jgi:isopenicillin N synthase-like dioxygenase
MNQVPTVDLRSFHEDQSDPDVLNAIDQACRDHGFFFLKGHGLDQLMERLWGATKDFFAAPTTVKNSVRRTAENPFGYYDRELTKQKRDQKEVFDFRTDGYMPRDPAYGPQWPENQIDFQDTLTEYFGACTTLSDDVMRLIYRSMGLDGDEASEPFGAQHTSAGRLNHYPAYDPVDEHERDQLTGLGDMALHHHTDTGAITLLLQDDVGGLQTYSHKGERWIDVPPEPGVLVVNVGDLMQVWTNDRYQSAIHRVTPVKPSGRYSVAYFYQPRFDAAIAPWADGQTPHYRSFTFKEFIKARMADNYADAGDEDVQITRYRVA